MFCVKVSLCYLHLTFSKGKKKVLLFPFYEQEIEAQRLKVLSEFGIPGIQHSTELKLLLLHFSPTPSQNKTIFFHSNAVFLLHLMGCGRDKF